MSDKHIFSPVGEDGEDRDTCRRCGHNFRDTTRHMLVDEVWPEREKQAADKLALALSPIFK